MPHSPLKSMPWSAFKLPVPQSHGNHSQITPVEPNTESPGEEPQRIQCQTARPPYCQSTRPNYTFDETTDTRTKLPAEPKFPMLNYTARQSTANNVKLHVQNSANLHVQITRLTKRRASLPNYPCNPMRIYPPNKSKENRVKLPTPNNALHSQSARPKNQ